MPGWVCHHIPFACVLLRRPGKDIHFIAASVKNGRDFSWVCTHKVRLAFQSSIGQANLTLRTKRMLKKAGRPTRHCQMLKNI